MAKIFMAVGLADKEIIYQTISGCEEILTVI